MKKTFVIAIIVTLATVLTFCGFNYYNTTTVGYTVEIEEGHSFTCDDCIEKEMHRNLTPAPVPTTTTPDYYDIAYISAENVANAGKSNIYEESEAAREQREYEEAIESLVSSKEENRVVIRTNRVGTKFIYAIYNLEKGDTVKIEGGVNNVVITQETDFLVGSFEYTRCNECEESAEYGIKVYDKNGDLIENY